MKADRPRYSLNVPRIDFFGTFDTDLGFVEECASMPLPLTPIGPKRLSIPAKLESRENDYPTETDRFTQAAAGCIRGLSAYSLRTLSFASTSTSDTS